MKDRKDFLDLETPKGFAERVTSAAEDALQKRQKAQRQKIWFLWGTPVLTAGIGFLLLRSLFFADRQAADVAALDFFEQMSGEMASEEFEMVTDMDLLEELDEIEEWSES